MPVEAIQSGVCKGSFTKLDDGSIECTDTIELRPSRKWKNDVDFHADLQIEVSNKPWCLTFDAKARESLEICLSEYPKFTYKSTILRLGTCGNTETTISYKKSNVVKASGRVVRDDKWVTYWVCYDNSNGRVSVGMGNTMGAQGIATLQLPAVKETKDTETAMPDAETLPDETEEQKETMPIATNDPPPAFPAYTAVGFRNAADRSAPIHLRSIRLTPMKDAPPLEQDFDFDMIILGEDELDDLPTTTQHTIRLLQDHRDAIVKAKARAIKFNTPYVPPALTASLNWSDARRLRANPTGNFATGIDGASPEEITKRNQRKERFGVEMAGVEVEALPIEQAWDKLELSGMQRLDPPNELWQNNKAENEAFAMEPATFVREKIHIFSMDWSAFKQIRTSDIITHFADFGPTYVEWLGDLSCNILFEDQHSAARALEGMSQELPSDKDPDLGNMGWRFGKTFLRKVADDKYGRKGTTARLLMRVATSLDVLQERPSSWPKPPDGFSTRKILGPDSDLSNAERKRKQKREAPSTEDMLNGALSSSRGGFTLEALEAERAAKRSKPI